MDYFRIGLILRPRGVTGEIKILSLTDEPKRFSRLKTVYIEEENGAYREISVKYAKAAAENAAVIKLAGVDTPEEAEALRNKYICVDRFHAVKLPEGSYFIKDLIGCRVESTDGAYLGELIDVYPTNANDVYVIRGDKKFSVPALKRLLNTVDTENKRIVLDAKLLEETALTEEL